MRDRHIFCCFMIVFVILAGSFAYAQGTQENAGKSESSSWWERTKSFLGGGEKSTGNQQPGHAGHVQNPVHSAPKTQPSLSDKMVVPPRAEVGTSGTSGSGGSRQARTGLENTRIQPGMSEVASSTTVRSERSGALSQPAPPTIQPRGTTTNSTANLSASSALQTEEAMNRMSRIRSNAFEKIKQDREGSGTTESTVRTIPRSLSSTEGGTATLLPNQTLLESSEIEEKMVQTEPLPAKITVPKVALPATEHGEEVVNANNDKTGGEQRGREMIVSQLPTQLSAELAAETSSLSENSQEISPRISRETVVGTITDRAANNLNKLHVSTDGVSTEEQSVAHDVSIALPALPQRNVISNMENIIDGTMEEVDLDALQTEMVPKPRKAQPLSSPMVLERPDRPLISDQKQNRRSVSSQVAFLEIEMNGPKKRIVGQDSPYEFKVINRGGATAEQVVIGIEVPKWAEINTTDFSVGSTQVLNNDDETNLISWSFDQLKPEEEQLLTVHLIPRERKTLNIAWNHQFKQPENKMTIDVQEASLEMFLEGPNEMRWGTVEKFRLRLRNSGTADVEDLQLTLQSNGSGPTNSQRRSLGTLRAGDEINQPIEVLVTQETQLKMIVQAKAAYGLQKEVIHTVNILRPSLTAFVDGAEMQFVGNQSEFQVVVQNNGTAPAENVEIKAIIPQEAKFVASSNGRNPAATPNQVFWTVGFIPAGEEFVGHFVCEMLREGDCKVEVAVQEKLPKELIGATAVAYGLTKVESIADLTMQLENPRNPVAVGKPATYKITVTNRGSKSAEDVDIIAAFAEGVTPVSVENGEAIVYDDSDPDRGGQVFFDRIAHLGPQKSLTFIVKAKANVPGNHKVRVELFCEPIHSHLVYEDVTYFYSQQPREVAGKRNSVNF